MLGCFSSLSEAFIATEKSRKAGPHAIVEAYGYAYENPHLDLGIKKQAAPGIDTCCSPYHR